MKTRDIKPSRQLIELVCFLRVTLLELTDVALLQSSRRSQQLFRDAADKAQSNRARGTTSLVHQAAKARAVLHDESKTWQARVIEAKELLAELAETAGGSFVSQVRRALAEDSQRVHACLAALKDLDFGGRDGDPVSSSGRRGQNCSAREPRKTSHSRMWAQPGMAWFETSTHARGTGPTRPAR